MPKTAESQYGVHPRSPASTGVQENARRDEPARLGLARCSLTSTRDPGHPIPKRFGPRGECYPNVENFVLNFFSDDCKFNRVTSKTGNGQNLTD
eukprot:2031275-Rhodomonas_salina.1